MDADNVISRLQTGESAVEQRMVFRAGEMFELSAGELQALCNKYPDHPLSKEYGATAARVGPATKLVVEKVGLDAIVQNRDTKIEKLQVVMDQGGVTALVNVERRILV